MAKKMLKASVVIHGIDKDKENYIIEKFVITTIAVPDEKVIASLIKDTSLVDEVCSIDVFDIHCAYVHKEATELLSRTVVAGSPYGELEVKTDKFLYR